MSNIVERIVFVVGLSFRCQLEQQKKSQNFIANFVTSIECFRRVSCTYEQIQFQIVFPLILGFVGV